MTYMEEKYSLVFKDKELEFRVNLKKGKVECDDEQVQARVWSIISNLFPDN